MKDSIDKIVSVYFAGVIKKQFEYKNKIYKPKKLVVSSSLLRGYTCPSNCGGCCPKFTLDYLPSEQKPYKLNERVIKINKKDYLIYSDTQISNRNNKCRNLNIENGRCKIYESRPFSCDFELIRFLNYQDKVILTQKLFGRGWNMKRINGERGALCEMKEPNDYSINEVMRKLNRLLEWTDYFDLDTNIPEIKKWIDMRNYENNLVLNI